MRNNTQTQPSNEPKQIGSLIRELMQNPDFILHGHDKKIGGKKNDR